MTLCIKDRDSTNWATMNITPYTFFKIASCPDPTPCYVCTGKGLKHYVQIISCAESAVLKINKPIKLQIWLFTWQWDILHQQFNGCHVTSDFKTVDVIHFTLYLSQDCWLCITKNWDVVFQTLSCVARGWVWAWDYFQHARWNHVQSCIHKRDISGHERLKKTPGHGSLLYTIPASV